MIMAIPWKSGENLIISIQIRNERDIWTDIRAPQQFGFVSGQRRPKRSGAQQGGEFVAAHNAEGQRAALTAGAQP
jgi:hypothetical protein